MADVAAAKEAKFVELQEKKAEEKKQEEQKKEEVKAAGYVHDHKHEHDHKHDEKAGAKKDEKKPEEKKEEKPEPKKREIVLERVYTIPLDVYHKPMMRRANAAITFIQNFLARHMKTDVKKVKIAISVNNLIRKRGSGRPLKKIKVKVTKDKEGVVLAELAA